MRLTPEEEIHLAGGSGRAAQKAMQILAALGKIYHADNLIPVASVQISGVSYDNLGDAGLEFLNELAENGGRVRVLTTLNPAGMDIENWQALGIPPDFAASQMRVIEAFQRMGVITTCTCTPYLSGNLPHFGEHIAWAESSAVCFANSVLGARTNREGGPSALAAAITGRTPAYGCHLDENRKPSLGFKVDCRLQDTRDFGALGVAIGKALESARRKPVPYITGVADASLEQLKSFCASLATYGGAALFHMEGITPEAAQFRSPADTITITAADLEREIGNLNSAAADEVDFVSLGCPHLSIQEIGRLAGLLEGKKVTKEMWVATSRPVKHIADQMGFTRVIEESGARFSVDTCCVVAPIQGRFRAMTTDSAKACYYAAAKNKFKTRLVSFDDAVAEALR